VIEAAEQTILQRVVPQERQGRVFGLAQSIEQSASPITAFVIGPVAQLIFIPFMTTGAGVEWIGGWFGSGIDRGLALLFTVTGVIGLAVTLISMRSNAYHTLSKNYMTHVERAQAEELAREQSLETAQDEQENLFPSAPVVALEEPAT
jgi:DHA3 family multidrug efflux protein-like MFS transporter